MVEQHIKNSITIIVLALMGLWIPCAAQDTICATGLMGKIIKNTDGTFYYSSYVRLDNKGEYITTLSYGRWNQVNDSIFEFTSSINTKHEMLKSYELDDSVNDTTGLTIDVYNENGVLLCKRNGLDIQHYAESSILGISVHDTSIQIYGVSPYGQWHLYCQKKEKTYGHQVIYIRDAFYYNLEYLYLFLIKKGDGAWYLFQKTKQEPDTVPTKNPNKNNN